ncbi:MAG: 30S ribosomal protein S18 [Anaerolineae bacterium]|nr:30S ribosomal protein S18 [Anaerolineae bacterium]
METPVCALGAGFPRDQEAAVANSEDRGRSDDRRRPGGGRRKFNARRNVCRMCTDNVEHIDYKDVNTLRHYISDHGRILPRRRTKTCARHQRMVSVAIKRARQVALLPYSAGHVREDGS